MRRRQLQMSRDAGIRTCGVRWGLWLSDYALPAFAQCPSPCSPGPRQIPSHLSTQNFSVRKTRSGIFLVTCNVYIASTFPIFPNLRSQPMSPHLPPEIHPLFRSKINHGTASAPRLPPWFHLLGNITFRYPPKFTKYGCCFRSPWLHSCIIQNELENLPPVNQYERQLGFNTATCLRGDTAGGGGAESFALGKQAARNELQNSQVLPGTCCIRRWALTYAAQDR